MRIKVLDKIANLETIEEKSFWVIAPTVAVLGVAGLTTAGSYGSPLPTIISAVLCLFIPVVLMVLVHRYRNYHSAYPLLCICIGAISVPVTFIFGGGFFSGMPSFCVVSTCICALCYSQKWRLSALLLCLLGNAASFYYVYYYGTPFPLIGQETIYNDIIFGYFFSSIAAFVAISLIITEVRKYRISQDVLRRYFDESVSKEILKKVDNDDSKLISGNRKAVILFIDISNFTSITEKMPSDLIAQFLNEFFTMAGKHIHDSEGVIDKYIGDCIMAYWFEKEGQNCVYNAIRSVLDVKEEMLRNSEMIYEKYGTELNFSAGISYGDIIFGDIGSNTMHDYTVIGDAVNTASRIESFAVAGEILISGAAASMVKDRFKLEVVEEDVYFKGKNKAVNLYRVLSEEKCENRIADAETYSGYALTVCGCRGSFPVSGLRFSEYGGETSCYVLKKDSYALIVDCGTGLKNAIDIVSDCTDIDVLLTHVHYDHILGLLMFEFPKNANIRFFGYFSGWKDKGNILNSFMEHPCWPVSFDYRNMIDVKLDEKININEDIAADFHLSDHPDNACVIELMIKDKKVCFYADCEDPAKLDEDISKGCDLLFFDGMFDDNDETDYTGWGHGTWQSGLRFAEKQHIKKLVITHHSPEIADHTLALREQKAREEVINVSFAKTGDRFLI